MGWLAGSDKFEMAQYYKDKGMTLYEALQSLYEKYGYFEEYMQFIELDGIAGKAQIAKIMDAFRADYFDAFADAKAKLEELKAVANEHLMEF
ncbi:hypothetical protein [Pseudoramibacter alactolyticus]|uniref:hypothetical protein n=1 Tax=Pseudoramibacter alactolyticus TaxID=113287 RepID=UPI0028EAA047|nr:hypothetical protein [Pseudoramibacter alactolyticus]